MERLSDTAIEIINELHTERLDYYSEYIPLIDAANRLAAYEDTGLEPEEIERIVDAYGRGHTLRTESAERLEIVREIKTDRLRELAKAEKDGRLEVLPCKVGDHILADGREAIVVWFFGYKTGRYLHAQFLDNAECADIPFYEIGKNRLSAREEAEAALAEKGSTNEDSGGL